MKRLRNYSEDIMTLPMARDSAYSSLKSAIEKHGKIKVASVDQGLILARARYGLQITKLEFELTDADDITTIKCRGKSDDIGNGAAMRVIDKITAEINNQTPGSVEVTQVAKADRIGMRKRVMYIVIAIIAIFGVKEIASGPGEIYGRYDSEEKTQYNNHIGIYESGDFLLHYDSQFGHGNRWGKYEYIESTNEIRVAFNDGLPELEQPLKLEPSGSKWRLINGSTNFVKNEGFHPDIYKYPKERYSYSK